ncbi:inositol 2-dehydrogenase [Sporosarcina newyorkensis]|uniref:Myo-inositol 2-dehydrogenase n=1 Tax=Sporosarcina newyorkensis TaxID=759851 RepID=A0A1T4YLM8_9BACL|nr:inositol 2-dehydrogenase [Sporosarcina newyorkensis]SKB02583.1 myo-inositol 2-dehydrogenase [Sporosarcina newyorkensis]
MSKLTIGIIGAGRIGRMHAENITPIPQIRIKTISDIFADSVREWAKELGIENVVTDYEEILNDNEIEAILICSPTDTHIPIIKQAAEKGKHIFCEKPVSFSVEDTEIALAVVEEAGVKMQIGFNRRFDRNFHKVHTTVKNGVIGEPHIVKITSRDPAPPPIEYIEKSGGLFFDMSIHDFDMARYVTGSEVVEVYAQGDNLIDPNIGKAGDIDTAVITLKFENGAIGIIDNSRKAVYGYDQRVEVFGSKGSITVENDRPTSAEISTEEGVFKDKLKYFFLERYKDAYITETYAFIESILHNKPLLCTGNDGLQAERIAKAADLSLKERRPVKIFNESLSTVKSN